MKNLETERLILRKITMDDQEAIYKYASNKEVAKYVTWEAHRTLEVTKGFIEFVLNQYKDEKVNHWGIEYKETRELIGMIDFVSVNSTHKIGEIGYTLSQDYWGKGIMIEAANEVIKFGFNELDLVRIEARCVVENVGSARVMEKVGMSYEGTIRKGIFLKGEHHDLRMYSILKDEMKGQ